MKTLGTGELAAIFSVAPRTVSGWIDSGQMQGFRLPPSHGDRTEHGERRVTLAAAMRFAHKNNLPTSGLPSGPLAIGIRKEARVTLSLGLPGLKVVECAFDAGIAIERTQPSAVLIDLSIGRGEALALARAIARSAGHDRTPLLALLADDRTDIDEFREAGFGEFYSWPTDAAVLLTRIAAAHPECTADPGEVESEECAA